MDKHADPDQMPHSVATDQGLHCLNINLNKIYNNTQQILAFESIHPIDKDVIFHWAKWFNLLDFCSAMGYVLRKCLFKLGGKITLNHIQ